MTAPVGVSRVSSFTPPRQNLPMWEIKYLSHQRKCASSSDELSPVGVSSDTFDTPTPVGALPAELCRRCGCCLDVLHIAAGVDRHPACYREPPATDDQHRRALFAVAATFPTARRVESP